MKTKSSRHVAILSAAAVCAIAVAGLAGAAPAKRPAAAAAPAPQKPASGPIARYDMRAGTVAGVGAGGGRGMGMAMMMGGGGRSQVQHELYLRLGSSQAPSGSPQADHFMPEGMQLGRSVQLVTPREERVPEEFPEGRRPKGRMLIYWGCGEHAGPGQPVVIDFAKLAAGQMPPGLWSGTILRDWGPTPANSRTFGRWPAEDGKYVKPGSSLPGAHRVAGNYSPEIAFTLAKDFMAPLSSRIGMTLPSGAKVLSWQAIPDATGYLATMFGGSMNQRGEMGDMVMWSSSATRQFGAGLSDWLSPATVAGLVRDRTVLPPETTSCAIPAEAIRDAGQFRTGMLTAFGPEEDFAYPPRPANPREPWNLQWTARIRHKSSTSWMDMPGMGGMGAYGGNDDPRGQQQQQQQRPRRGLGGILGGGLGF